MRFEETTLADLLVVGFEGPELRESERRILARFQPGGVILFARNLVDVPQLHRLMGELRSLLPRTLFYLDSEGGPVDRLRNLVSPAPSGAFLSGRLPRQAEKSGLWIGHSLAHFGFQVDFAPVVDLNRLQHQNALDDRYFGTSPRAVSARARAFLHGLHRAGIGGCLKHFPGLGAARSDTHFEPAEVSISPLEMENDLKPFRNLGSLAQSVMIGHATYPRFEPAGLPATLSSRISVDLLRRELGFRGLAFGDDLEMQALDPWGDLSERALKALEAGSDVLLVCRSLERVPEVVHRLQEATPHRVAEARGRLQAYRGHLESLRQRTWRPKLAMIRRRLRNLSFSAEGMG